MSCSCPFKCNLFKHVDLTKWPLRHTVGGRLEIQKRPGGRGAGGMGVVIRLRSSRARTSISSTTSAAGRRTTLPTSLLSFASRFFPLAPLADMAVGEGFGEELRYDDGELTEKTGSTGTGLNGHEGECPF